MNVRRSLIVAAALIVLAGAAVLLSRGSSSPTSPRPAPPRTGFQAALAVTSSGDLLKATPRGLFRGADGGQTWHVVQLPRALVSAGVGQIAADPERPGVIYASRSGTGVFLTEGNGATWRLVITGLPSRDVEALAIHAFRRKTLFVSVRGKGIYRTEDGGGRWERMDGGPADAPVAVLAHSPLEGSMNTGWL